jgi:hypothetical protein
MMRSIDMLNKMPDSLRSRLEAEPCFLEQLKEGHRLEQCLTSFEVMKSVYHSLLPAERKTLNLLLQHTGYIPFEWSQIDRLSHNSLMSGAELKWGLLKLRQKGIVFTLRKTWGEHIYLIPRDSFAIWQRIVMESLPIQLTGSESSEIEPLEDTRRGMGYDVFQLLVYTAKHGLQLTQKGTIHKRHIQKITAMIDIKEDDLMRAKLHYAGQEIYPPAFAVVYDAALRLGLIVQQVNEIKLQMDKVEVWLHQTAAAMQDALYQLWTALYSPSEVWKQHLSTAMEQIKPGVWFSIECLMEWLQRQNISLQHEADMEQIMEDEWLKPLMGFGWMEKGRTDSGRIVYRWTINEYGEEKVFIQPDFEIIVPPTVPFHIRWELECLANPIKLDRFSHYLMNKESILRASENGRSSEDILAFLQQHCKYVLPENVMHVVEEWSGQYGKVCFSEVLLLRCKEQATAEAIAKHPECSRFITARLGELDFIVEAGQMEEFKAVLDKYEFVPMQQLNSRSGDKMIFPRLNTGTATADVQENNFNTPAPHSSQGLIYTKNAVHYYQFEDEMPGTDEVYPRLEQVPSIWLHEYRSYHPSTRRELIEQAIEWRACIKLRKENKNVVFIPERIEEFSGQSWCVNGLESDSQISLLPEEWKEMQLILPGINDIPN